MHPIAFLPVVGVASSPGKTAGRTRDFGEADGRFSRVRALRLPGLRDGFQELIHEFVDADFEMQSTAVPRSFECIPSPFCPSSG